MWLRGYSYYESQCKFDEPIKATQKILSINSKITCKQKAFQIMILIKGLGSDVTSQHKDYVRQQNKSKHNLK